MGKDGLQARITALEEEVESVADWQAIFSNAATEVERTGVCKLETVTQQEAFL